LNKLRVVFTLNAVRGGILRCLRRYVSQLPTIAIIKFVTSASKIPKPSANSEQFSKTVADEEPCKFVQVLSSS